MKLRDSLIKFSSSGCGVHLTVIDVPSTKSKVILGGGMLLPERNKYSTIHQFVGKGDSAYLDLCMFSEITASFFMRSTVQLNGLCVGGFCTLYRLQLSWVPLSISIYRNPHSILSMHNYCVVVVVVGLKSVFKEYFKFRILNKVSLML